MARCAYPSAPTWKLRAAFVGVRQDAGKCARLRARSRCGDDVVTMRSRGLLATQATGSACYYNLLLQYVEDITSSARLCHIRATVRCMRESRCAEQALNGRAQGKPYNKPYNMLHLGEDSGADYLPWASPAA